MTSRSFLVCIALLAFVPAGCADDGGSPTSPTREVVPQELTDEIAQTSAAATAWILNDLAELAAYWAEGELRSSPARLQRATLPVTFDEGSSRWVVELESVLELEGESYEISGAARVAFLAAGTAVRDAENADAMDVVAEFSVLPRLRAKGAERDLDLAVTLRMGVADLASLPLSLEGSGHTTGTHLLVDPAVEQQASIDLDWSFLLGSAYRNCCPEGTLELSIENAALMATYDGSPVPLQSGVFDGTPVSGFFVEDFSLPCVQVGMRRGSVLQSGGRLMVAAGAETPVMRVEVAGQTLDSRPPVWGELRLEGQLGGQSLSLSPVSIRPSTTLGAALDSLLQQVRRFPRWDLDLHIDDDGALIFDNSSQLQLPPETRTLWLRGTLPEDAYPHSSHLVTTRELLAAADPASDLRYLRSGAGGDDLALENGDVVALQGSVEGVSLAGNRFTIGSTSEVGGTRLDELLAWLEGVLETATRGPVPVGVTPQGRVEVHNDSETTIYDLRLAVGGQVDFNQLFVFGSTVAPGASARSTAPLLRPATLIDPLSDLRNGDGDPLEFDFSHDDNTTTIVVTGTLGNEAIFPRSMVVELGETTLGDLLSTLREAFSISNPSGVGLNEEGRIEIWGDPGAAFDIDTIVLTEEGNVFSNLGISADFTVVSSARDAILALARGFAFDPYGNAREMVFTLRQPTIERAWSLDVQAIGDWEVVRGGHGTLTFSLDGAVSGYSDDSGTPQLACWVPEGGPDGTEFSIDIAYGGPLGIHVAGPQASAYVLGDGLPYIVGAGAVNLRLVLECSDISERWTAFEISIPSLPGGSVVTSPTRLLSVGTLESRLRSLRGPMGASMFGVGGPELDLGVRATLDEETHELLQTVSLDTTMGALLHASFESLGFPVESLYVDATGHLQVFGADDGPTVQHLGFVERGIPNPLLESSLGFDVTQQAFAGCR